LLRERRSKERELFVAKKDWMIFTVFFLLLKLFLGLLFFVSSEIP